MAGSRPFFPALILTTSQHIQRTFWVTYHCSLWRALGISFVSVLPSPPRAPSPLQQLLSPTPPLPHALLGAWKAVPFVISVGFCWLDSVNPILVRVSSSDNWWLWIQFSLQVDVRSYNLIHLFTKKFLSTAMSPALCLSFEIKTKIKHSLWAHRDSQLSTRPGSDGHCCVTSGMM